MKSHRAATLVELMVTMSIIGTMASLLLPAIQQARESSRANGCRNNLHQVGIAILDYESAHTAFPKGAEGRYDRKLSPSNMFGLSWWPDALAHMEECNVTDSLDRKGANTGWAYLNARNGELANNFGPSFFFCPSSPVEHFVRSGDYQVACPSYTGISGATNHDGFEEERVSRCCRSEGQISGGGVLIPNAVVKSRQVSDGLSKVLLIGEQSDFAYTDSGLQMNVGPGYALGWLGGSNSTGTPPTYGSWLSPSYNLSTIRYRLNERHASLEGICEDKGANNPLLSPHLGVVNLLYCDGSVHSLDESIDLNLLKSLATRDDGG